ncbi:MAG: hypothetical protein EBT03_09085 [Betaproteobacteria bacterium]|nr:hypothetical protein [Betaproteobacteria bacterium]NCA17570.1 hypothetical protein [Betaproteobacteria bacterium]
MRFLIDAQLPPLLARFLAERGAEAITCRDVRLRDADDDEIWRFAVAGGWCVVTKDEDFAIRRIADSTGPSIVWLRIGKQYKPDVVSVAQPAVAECCRGAPHRKRAC